MNAEMWIVFATIIVALCLFVTEVVRVEITALGIAAFLMVSGVLTPQDALAGFANVATVTVGAMFVLSAGLRQTGAIDGVGAVVGRLARRQPALATAAVLITAAVVSAFINNTAAVAIFIPIVMALARDLGRSPSTLLMPVSFLSMFGGVTTLIGTSTNLIVDSIVRQRGLTPFGMFEFAPLGALLLVIAIAYMLTIGVRRLPDRRGLEDLAGTYDMSAFLTDVELSPNAKVIGQPLDDNWFTDNYDVAIVQVFRDGRSYSGAGADPSIRLQPGDVVRLRGAADEISRLLTSPGTRQQPFTTLHDADLEGRQDVLIEAVVAPDSDIAGRTIGDIDFPRRFGAQVLGIRYHSQLQHEELDDIRLKGGYALLLKIDAQQLDRLRHAEHFVVVSEVHVPDVRCNKMPIAVAVIVAVVGLTAAGVLPIVASAMTGAIVMVVTGCLRPEEAYDAINWQVVLLLAGVLSLGVAVQQTGGAALLADTMLGISQPFGPVAIVAGFFLLSFILTELISNNATAALLAPVAINAAQTLAANPRPLLVAVTFAASFSFFTPTGYQTNLLVYGPGQYRYSDYARLGAPLSVIVWVVASLAIPLIWPLQPA